MLAVLNWAVDQFIFYYYIDLIDRLSWKETIKQVLSIAWICCWVFAFSAFTLLVVWQEGHPAWKKTEWWGVGMVVLLGWGADLHMPLPLTVSCSSKSRLVLPFWYWLTQLVPDKVPLNGCLVAGFIDMWIYLTIVLVWWANGGTSSVSVVCRSYCARHCILWC